VDLGALLSLELMELSGGGGGGAGLLVDIEVGDEAGLMA